jgi:HlyD family secretion protein
VGQTVAASLQAPTLFTIAQDLTRMQVEAAVDEADIGRLREGMPASFSVDAFPGQTFQGEIVQIRKAPQVVQNVVTYTVVIAVANPDRVLMPGMTANVRIEVDRRADALRVPNAALRFRPAAESGTETGRAPAAPPPTGSPPSGARSGAVGGPQASLRESLTRELTLTPEQQAGVTAILEATGQAMAALRDQGLDEGAREAARRRIRGESQEKIRQLLTTEQRAKYEALVAAQARRGEGAPPGMPARVFALGPDGKPRGIAIVIGLSDGSASEVIQGDLQPGQELLIGQSPSSATSRPSTGPRMRF